MVNIFPKIKEVLKTYKKKIITVIVAGVATVIIIGGVGVGVKYSHAKSNIKYTQDQLEKIALTKVPGEVVDVKKELNLKRGVYEYDFKIKDKDNMLQEVKLESQYGTIVRDNHKEHGKSMEQNKKGHDRFKEENNKGIQQGKNGNGE